MARPISDHHRRICVGVLGRYVGKDHRCTRDLIGWLAAGSDSTRTGLMRIHVGSLVDDLGWSKPQIRAALARLQDDGLIVWSEEQRTVACVFVLNALTIPTENHRTSYLQQCQLFSDCPAKSYAVKAIQAIEIKRRDGAYNAQSNALNDGASTGASTGADQDSGFRLQVKLPTDVGSVLGSRTGATQPTATASARTPQTALGALQAVSDDHAPTQSPKRQPRGQDGAKTAKPRSLAQQPPTLEETRAIFASIGGSAHEADGCFDYWLSRGFASKNGPLKDWAACCRTWNRNAHKAGQTYGNRKAQAPVMVFDQADLERQMAQQTKEMEEAEARGESWF